MAGEITTARESRVNPINAKRGGSPAKRYGSMTLQEAKAALVGKKVELTHLYNNKVFLVGTIDNIQKGTTLSGQENLKAQIIGFAPNGKYTVSHTVSLRNIDQGKYGAGLDATKITFRR